MVIRVLDTFIMNGKSSHFLYQTMRPERMVTGGEIRTADYSIAEQALVSLSGATCSENFSTAPSLPTR